MAGANRQEKIRGLLENRGWKIVEEYIKDKIKFLTKHIRNCEVIMLVETRSRLDAYESILEFVDSVLNEEEVEEQEKQEV